MVLKTHLIFRSSLKTQQNRHFNERYNKFSQKWMKEAVKNVSLRIRIQDP